MKVQICVLSGDSGREDGWISKVLLPWFLRGSSRFITTDWFGFGFRGSTVHHRGIVRELGFLQTSLTVKVDFCLIVYRCDTSIAIVVLHGLKGFLGCNVMLWVWCCWIDFFQQINEEKSTYPVAHVAIIVIPGARTLWWSTG